MQLSDGLLRLLRHFEGFRERAYQDSAGVWTIGFGTTRYQDGRRVRQGDAIAYDEAQAILKAQATAFAERVNAAVRVPLTQPQFDALVSFAYNVGSAAFERSTLCRLLNDRQYLQASEEFHRWNQVAGKSNSGLSRRRAAECALFLYGTP
jgi:lysozyme